MYGSLIVCVYVCVCENMFLCTHVCMYMHTQVHISLNTGMHACRHVCMNARTCVCANEALYVHVYLPVLHATDSEFAEATHPE